MIEVFSPATGELVGKVPRSSCNDVNDLISAADAAFVAWKLLSLKSRALIMWKLYGLLEAHKEELESLITLENGKNRAEAVAEITKCCEMVEAAASLSQNAAGKQQDLHDGGIWQEARQPVGIIFSITPFSSPGKHRHTFFCF
jgi:acyl-CoA reductase-like NAD-dependent aldehyde dehydrogenase